MTKETFEKMTQVMASDEFEAKFDACESTEALLALLKEFDVQVTAEELQTYLDSVGDSASGDDDLDDDALEMVSGGGAIWNWIKRQVKEIKNKFEYILGGGFTYDCATGKRRHPWV